MDRKISENARRVDYEKQDLEDLITFFCDSGKVLAFFKGRISTNPDEKLWIPDSRGWTDKAFREYFKDAPRILLKVAETYRDRFRKEGGRFWIDWRGAYSMRDQEYFVLWTKDHDLTIYATELRKELSFSGLRNSVIRRLTSPWTGDS